MRSLRYLPLALALAAGCCRTAPQPSAAEVPLCFDGTPVSHDKGIYTLYPDPAPAAPVVPAGYKPCYLGHYGRHGSRYMQYDSQYVHIGRVLSQAHADGKLTVLGESVYERFERVRPQLAGRGGELSSVGVEQHRRIAQRMAEDWPGLFRKEARIVMRTTNLERTMLSMASFASTLTELRPGLVLDMDGSHLEMDYLNPHSKDNPACTPEYSLWRSDRATWMPEFLDFVRTKVDVDGIAARLFCDMDYATANFDLLSLERDLFLFSDAIWNTPVEKVNFYDVFTSGELHAFARIDPAIAYIQKGRFPDPRALGTPLCATLLGDFVRKTQEDLEQGVSARFRFGHDGCMFGLFALMDIPGWNQVESDYEKIWGLWDTSSVTMGSNIQMLCCRGKKGDVIFTWMLNLKPMPLPLEEVAPGFYRLDDFVSKYSGRED